MKKATIIAAALAAWSAPALALVEPDPAGRQAQPEPGQRDSRVRSVAFEAGQVIRLVGTPGRTLMVGLPRGLEVFTVLTSDQDVIEQREPDPQEQQQARTGAPQPQQRRDDTCSLTKTLQVCVKRDRFLALMPLVRLSPQPLHVIALRPRPNAEPEEVTFLFELETQDEDATARTAGPAVAVGSGYYLVNVTMAASPAPPVRRAAPAAAPPRPVVRRAPPPPQPVPEPPPINSNYELQGDRALVGASR